jgi:hypothetical protein
MNIIKLIRQKKLVTSEQLAQAIVLQRKNSPSFTEVLFGLLDDDIDKALDIIESAIETKKDIAEVAKELLGDDFIKKAENELKNQSLSVLRSLVELDSLDHQQCDQVIQDLLAAEQVSSGSSQKMTQESEEPEISEAALESLRELVEGGNLDPSMLADLEKQKKK